MRLTSIEFSFDPCNIYRDVPRGVGYPADARSVGDSHPSCFSIEPQGRLYYRPHTYCRLVWIDDSRNRQLSSTSILNLFASRSFECLHDMSLTTPVQPCSALHAQESLWQATSFIFAFKLSLYLSRRLAQSNNLLIVGRKTQSF